MSYSGEGRTRHGRAVNERSENERARNKRVGSKRAGREGACEGVQAFYRKRVKRRIRKRVKRIEENKGSKRRGNGIRKRVFL